jgi:hypothetical protein
MKPNLLVLLSLALSAAVFAADPAPPAPPSPSPAAPAAAAKPELRGVLATATQKRFNLSLIGSGHSEWDAVGEKFGDWKLAEFRDADQTLVLRQADGTELDLSLAANKVVSADADTKATVADADAVLGKMKLGKILEAAMAPQKKMLLNAVQKIASQAGLTPDSGEAYTAFQKKAADLIASALDPKQMETDMAQIYSSVYTKEELSGLGDFFDSPIGQVYTAKAPQVQQQLQAVMIPRMMAIGPQLQALAKQSSAPAPTTP